MQFKLNIGFLLLLILSNLSACKSDNSSEATTQAPAEVGLSVEGAYMYAPPPGQKMGAVYLKLHNTEKADRQIVDVATDVAGTAMIHRTYYEDGMMRMRHMHHMSIGAGQTLVFEPSGYHIMLMDLEHVPAIGEYFAAELAFDQGQTLNFQVEVKSQQ